MSQAIHYISQSYSNQNPSDPNKDNQERINQNGTALSASIPLQAVNIPVGEILDKTTLLTSLAEACNFPSYFSHNWDSAWDCLTDSDVSQLILDITSVKTVNTEDFDLFQRIIEDAYRDFGKPQLWIITLSANNV